jgi:hypothetical protein
MDNKLTKSLTDLIDETLQELDELRKSRFAASEIKIEGPGDGIAGKPSDGDLHAKKAEDKDKDGEEDDKDKDDKKVEKGVLDEAEEEKAEKADKDDKKEDKDEDDKEPHEDDPKHEDKEKKMAEKLLAMHKGELKKSSDEANTLMKSYVEERVKPLEDKLSTILDLVNKIADQPVAPKGATARTPVTPLLKSGDEGYSEPLSKGEVASKLFELKKSGTKVDSLDIAKAEMGQDLKTLIKKYEIS